MRVEEILIATIPPVPGEERPTPARARNAVLEQSGRFRFCRFTFELLDERILSVRMERRYRHACTCELDIGMLDPEPKRSLRASGWYLTAAILFSVAAVVPDLAGFGDRLPDSAAWPLIPAAAAGLSLLLAACHFRDRLIFRSRNGRVPVLILRDRNPDRETFNMFTELVIRRIREVGISTAGINEMLSEELRQHRRLMEAGLLSNKRYDSAKRRILRQHR